MMGVSLEDSLLQAILASKSLPVPFARTEILARLTGPLAHVQVRQHFAAREEDSSSLIYRFHLPPGAEPTRLTLTSATRCLETRIREVQTTFSAERSQQFQVLLPDAEGGYELSWGELAAGEELHLELDYVQWLAQDGHEYLFSWSPIVNPEGGTTELRVEVEGGATHLWSFAGTAAAPFSVRVPAEAALYRTGEHFFACVPPHLVSTPSAPRDLVFVLDRSVSMDGSRRRSARAAISRVLGRLEENDRFALWPLDRRDEFRGGRFVSRDAVGGAESWLDHLRCGESAGVSSSLQSMLELKEEPGRIAWAVVISDGPLECEEHLVSRLGERTPLCRLSFLQIGGSSGDALLPYLARLGGGSFLHIPASGGADEAAAWMERDSRLPGGAVGVVDRGLNYLPDSLSPDRLATQSARPLLLFGRKLGSGGLELRWADFRLHLESRPSQNAAVGLFWARERISMLAGRLRARPSTRRASEAEMRRLAMQHGLVTDETALVLSQAGDTDSGVAWMAPGRSRPAASAQSEVPASDQLRALSEEAPTTRWAQQILAQALLEGASHVHLSAASRVQFRLDGVLHARMQPPAYMLPALQARLRVLAGLQPEPARVARQGRIQFELEGKQASFALVTVPGERGEKIVLTTLRAPESEQLPRLDVLTAGWTEGLVLVVGPQRSGVSTTLRRLLRHASHWGRHVVSSTPEGDGVLGVEHLTFDEPALPGGLDCDGWLAGTLKSASLAISAVMAATEGRLVMAGIHAASREQAMRKLVQLGVDRELLESVVVAVVEQRMLRRLCGDCSPGCGVLGTGCERCSHTGYSERVVVLGSDAAELQAAAQKLVDAGTVDADEVRRILGR